MQAQSIRSNGNTGDGRGLMGRRTAARRRVPSARFLWRAIGYVNRYRRLVTIAYGALFVATAAQLMVPQLVQNIIDTIVKAFTADRILGLPAQVQSVAANRLGTTLEQLKIDQGNATN